MEGIRRLKSWTCPSPVEHNGRLAGMTSGPVNRPGSPNHQAETQGPPAAGDTCSHLRNRALAASSRFDSGRWCVWRPFSSCCWWWSSPAVPSSSPLRLARRSCSAPCPPRFVINSGSRRAPAVSTIGPARSASRCTPSTSGNPPRRVRSSTRNAWRSISPRLFSAARSCSAGSMSPGPRSCSTPRRKAPRRPAAGREGSLARPSSATVPSFDIHGGRVRDLALTSVSANGTRVAVRGLSLSFTGEGPGVVRGEVVVSGGWSVRRGTAEIGFDRARADVSLAGTSLALTSITMESPVAAISGTAHLDVSRGDLEGKYDARVALGALQKWSTEMPPLEGELEASGTIGGTLDHPVATLRWPRRTASMAGRHGRQRVGGRPLVRHGSDDRSVQRLEPRAGCEPERERAPGCR